MQRASNGRTGRKPAAELCIKERLTESPRKRTSEKCSTQISGAERAFHFPCAQLYLGIFLLFSNEIGWPGRFLNCTPLAGASALPIRVTNVTAHENRTRNEGKDMRFQKQRAAPAWVSRAAKRRKNLYRAKRGNGADAQSRNCRADDDFKKRLPAQSFPKTGRRRSAHFTSPPPAPGDW